MNKNNILKNEETEQMSVIAWANMQRRVYPELAMLYHCPNGGSRNKAEAVKLKQMGVVPGIPDLHLPVSRGYHIGLYIEMKFGSGRLQESQKEMLKEFAAQGHYCVVCYSASDAINILKEYCKLERRDQMSLPNLSILKAGKVKQI